MPSTKKSSGVYSPHPGLWMVQKWRNELPAKTGRSLYQIDDEMKHWLKEAYEIDE